MGTLLEVMRQVRYYLVWIYLGAISSNPQFRLNLGQIFGGLNQNRPNNENKNNGNQRLDLGQIAGGILGNVVGQALNNTDVQVGLGNNGNLQVAVLPKNPGNNNGNNGDNGERCSSGMNCDCWERSQDYAGGDLRIRNNPSQVSSAEECQSKCQSTSSCTHWSWERRGGGFSRGNNRFTRCWLKSSSFRKSNNFNRISGPRACIDIQINNPTTSSSSCTTTGGGRKGVNCVFPFTYRDVKYTGCTLEDADDGKPWCSTKTDANGQHVGGQGQWGHCASNCKTDSGNSNAQQTVHVNVQGSNSLSNTKLSQIPWLNNGDLPLAAAAAIGAAGGVSQNDVNNRFFLGLNEPNVAHQTCAAPGGSQGSCRHFHHCVQPAFFNFITFLSHMCIIQGRYLGVCCPNPVTPAPTQAPLHHLHLLQHQDLHQTLQLHPEVVAPMLSV